MENDNQLFISLLTRWYAEHARELPWRNTTDAYRIWVSEIILQQTRVAQGYDYYLRFIDRFPTVEALATAQEDEVMKYWQGLGYYSRARNMHAAARDIMERWGGVFPSSYDDIRSLKGVGDYTAAAIASFAYNEPHAVVDGNVYRVLSRLFDVDIPIDTPAGKRYFAELAYSLLDREHPGLYNQALMELGALQCLPQGCNCTSCPLQDMCAARASHRVDSLPVKQGKVSIKSRFFHYFAVECDGYTWLHKRDARDIWRNLYEFPLIETDRAMELTELTSSDEYRQLFDGMGECELIRHPFKVKHVLTHRIIYATFYTMRVVREPASLAQYVKLPVTEIDCYAVSRLTELYLLKCADEMER